MNEKIYKVFKILIIIVLMVAALIIKIIPEYKETKGSSDTYINIETIENLVEININDQFDIILIVSEKKISNILFLDETSLCLYNENIEGNTLKNGINKILNILIDNNILVENTPVTIVKYKEEYYEEIKNYITEALNNYQLNIIYTENSNTIETKAKSLSLSGTNEEEYIESLELYSKEIIRYKKNNVSAQVSDENTLSEINDETAKMYADSIYEKITKYKNDNQITNQEISSSNLPIYLIPADATGIIYPTLESWYYIEEGKVYAYIVIEEEQYHFCYQGEINKVKEGEC